MITDFVVGSMPTHESSGGEWWYVGWLSVVPEAWVLVLFGGRDESQ